MDTSSIHRVQVVTPLMPWKIVPKAWSKTLAQSLKGSEGWWWSGTPPPPPTGAELFSGTLVYAGRLPCVVMFRGVGLACGSSGWSNSATVQAPFPIQKKKSGRGAWVGGCRAVP